MLYISLLLALLAVACLIFVPNTVILLSFVAIMHGFAVYSACHALLHKRDSRAALGWIAIILFMPPVGLPLYWLFGIARIDSQAVRLMEKAAQKVMGGLVDLHGKSLTEKPEGFIDKAEVPHAPAPASPAAVCSKATTSPCCTTAKPPIRSCSRPSARPRNGSSCRVSFSVTTKWARASPPPCAPLPNVDATCACSWTAWAPSTCGRAGANASARTSSSPTSCRRASSRPSFPSTCGRTAKS